MNFSANFQEASIFFCLPFFCLKCSNLCWCWCWWWWWWWSWSWCRYSYHCMYLSGTFKMHVCLVISCVACEQWHTDTQCIPSPFSSLYKPNMWRRFCSPVGIFSCSISSSLFSIRWHSKHKPPASAALWTTTSTSRLRRCCCHHRIQQPTIKRNGHNFPINSSTFIMLLSFLVFSIYLAFVTSRPICGQKSLAKVRTRCVVCFFFLHHI